MFEEDRQLIKALASGDNSAADEFVRQWQPRIYAWVQGRTSSRRVDDYVQEVWLQLATNNWYALLAWNGLNAEHPVNPNSLAGYLRMITFNKVTSLYRRDNNQLPESPTPFDFADENGLLGRNPLTETEADFLMAYFELCFEVMSQRDQNLFVMWEEGHQDSHTARILDMTANNVRQRRCYMLNKLRECLDRKLPGYFTYV